MSEDLVVNERVVIPSSDLQVKYTRASGPGGQHVNTSDTGVILRFAMDSCTALWPSLRQRIRDARPSSVTQEGDFLIRADRHRSQKMNLDDARQRLVDVILANLRPPKPRRATKPTKASKRRRLDSKKARGSLKRTRGKVERDG